ncbi:MAG: SDR family oxidoreductase [Ruminococcaceae bacterium]|nr:SDR family oxidoreductase [Oscillospiraceae bacterium]
MQKQKKVLVTGGARGIGEAICRALSADGWFVYIHCNSSVSEAENLCSELGNSQVVVADLSSSSAVDIISEICADADAIVNNAGVALVDLFDRVTDMDMRRLFEINLFAPMNITRRLLPQMISKKQGAIVNISSIFGENGGSCEVDYSVSKSALIGFTKALAKEVGPAGIRVNCVCPGIIDTDMNGNLSFDDIESLCDEIPISRVGEPEDVADTVAFLLSDKARYITGAVIDVNGGWQG